ncbi:uncharacterized protein CIMG_13170 [Coccidioides immitis RS]|uniref:C2H2-type domain-containing protein n=1 Tax=Coccidioides immitis (strain RS) TaxID=246410 RepID=A0A0D8JUC9_COCIM|nr:uncharacterized protein CIMG_13170 [Coccidioides immitis RS]KJF60719.1 hypothetical protein CIMG_13170 [Coccidioides immitis RS]
MTHVAVQDACRRPTSPFQQNFLYTQAPFMHHSAHPQQPLPFLSTEELLQPGQWAEPETIWPRGFVECQEVPEQYELFPSRTLVPDQQQYGLEPPPACPQLPKENSNNHRPMRQTPEYSPLTDQTNSELLNPTSSSPTYQPSSDLISPLLNVFREPQDSPSNPNMYGCTYRKCTLRFETPTKLEEHKQLAHHQFTRKPHNYRCNDINLSTGKSCSRSFSRPYDLTRHKATVHDVCKQKAQCLLCGGTFSRDDALIRHMRMVHSEVNQPDKRQRSYRHMRTYKATRI